jgi:LPS sulfotransferase NodH
LLTQSGVHGQPEEFLDIRKQMFRSLYDDAGGSRARYLRWLFEHRSSPNGAFGLKLHWNQGVAFVRGARTDAMAHARLGSGFRAVRSLARDFDDLRYVWVRRRDRIGQAVSLYRARNTNQWVRPDGDPNARRSDPPFDVDEIDRALRWLTRVDAGWDRYFRRVGTVPFVLFYEDLASDQATVLAALGGHLGVPLPTSIAPRLERQRDSWSTEMREQFISARGLPTVP